MRHAQPGGGCDLSRSRCICVAVAFASAVSPGRAAGQVTAQYDNARSGAAIHEVTLTPQRVRRGFGRVAVLRVDGDVYAQPLYMPPSGSRSAELIVATEQNTVYAFDATTLSPAPLWRVHLGTPVSARDVRCPFIRPSVGITSTPVIDSASGSLYVLTRTATGMTFAQTLHKLDVRDGREQVSPVDIEAQVRGTGAGAHGGVVAFDPLRENARAALLLTRDAVYVAWASSCDVAPYHGWVMAFDARTLRRRG